MQLPAVVPRVIPPPLKTQGIKTGLVQRLAASVSWDGRGRWIEPFVGSGAVALNLRPERALLADANPHAVGFLAAVGSGHLTGEDARTHLEREGRLLLERGEAHYYAVRERFNATPTPLDYLFLSRACFNGLVRFNRRGGMNVPFCRKPERFRPAYVTKIVHQVEAAERAMAGAEWAFACQDWRLTLAQAERGDCVYLDPPYVGRHADYHQRWTEAEAEALAEAAAALPCRVIVSMWLQNQHRHNPHVERCWGGFTSIVVEHYYHVGARSSQRGAMTEVLLVSPG